MGFTAILFLSVCLATIPTEARWPRAARPVPAPRPQERRTPGLPLPRQLVPRRPPAPPSRTARVTDWRKPKPVRTQKWGGRNYIFQDNRWKPLFEKQQQKRTKQGRYVKQPLVKKAPPPKAPYGKSQRPKAVAPPQLWPKPPTWPPATRSPFPTRRVEPPTTSRPIARTFPSYPANPNSIRRIDTGVVKDAVLAESLIPDVEIDGLKIYKFRGEDSMPGYIPPPDFLWSQARVTSRDSITPPSVTPAPVPTPRTWRPELPPPFPTRHTTRRPDQQRNPVIIIAQSSVQKN